MNPVEACSALFGAMIVVTLACEVAVSLWHFFWEFVN